MPRISRSVAVELLRTGTSEGSALKDDIRYVALCGSHPQVDFTVPLTQRKFNDLLEQLRYTPNNESAVRRAREDLEAVVRGIFSSVSSIQTEAVDVTWLHLRLVVAPKELGLLPYQFSLTPPNFPGAEDKPFLVNSQRLTTLTREIRQNAPRDFAWPAVPRLLFAWADPGKPVPHTEHADRLMAALMPWARPLRDNAEPVPDIAPRFKELPHATLSAIRDEILKSPDNPYTHVHILAHGTKVPDRDGERFALALHNEGAPQETRAVDGWTLADALAPGGVGEGHLPAVVVISACDGGNVGGPLVPGASLAHALHTSGVPYVLASQFPLSEEGSVDLVSELYPRLFKGEDPRAAVYHVRDSLLRNHSNTHDWASLVAYARFPENLDQQLEWVRLKLVLARMKTAHSWVDHILKFRKKIEQTFADVETRLGSAIDDLKKLLAAVGPDNPKTQNENLGLLGSAYKRKSEHLHWRAELHPANVDADRKGSRDALAEAARWYVTAHDTLLSDHWVGCQYLSLAAITKGRLTHEQDRWTVVRFGAKLALDNSSGRERLWPLGTLAELYLLQLLTVAPERFDEIRPSALAQAAEYLQKFARVALETDAVDQIESTVRQFDRYISWWPNAFPSQGTERLKAAATELRAVLPSPADL